MVLRLKHKGENLTMSEWSARTGINRRTLHSRVMRHGAGAKKLIFRGAVWDDESTHLVPLHWVAEYYKSPDKPVKGVKHVDDTPVQGADNTEVETKPSIKTQLTTLSDGSQGLKIELIIRVL